jgi:hypothetical protein
MEIISLFISSHPDHTPIITDKLQSFTTGYKHRDDGNGGFTIADKPFANNKRFY